MNTHKTFSLLAAAIIVAGQATVFAMESHGAAQSRDSYENRYEAKTAQSSTAYVVAQNGSSIRA